MRLAMSTAPCLAAAPLRSAYASTVMNTLEAFGAIRPGAPVDSALLALRDPHNTTEVNWRFRHAWSLPEGFNRNRWHWEAPSDWLKNLRRFHDNLIKDLGKRDIPKQLRFPRVRHSHPNRRPNNVPEVASEYFTRLADTLRPERKVPADIAQSTPALFSWRISVASYMHHTMAYQIAYPELMEIARWVTSLGPGPVTTNLFAELIAATLHFGKCAPDMTEGVMNWVSQTGLNEDSLARLKLQAYDVSH